MDALEALNNLKNRALQDCDFTPWTVPEADILAARQRMNEKTEEEYAILEKQLKALGVLEKLFKSSFTYKYKLENSLDCGQLTQEEYELLKEVLS